MDPKPSIGRTVHYRLIDTGQPVPAIVTKVSELDPEIVDLHVMFPRHVIPEGDVVGAGCFGAQGVKKGETPGHWSWPPKL